MNRTTSFLAGTIFVGCLAALAIPEPFSRSLEETPPDNIGVIATSDPKIICGRIDGLTYSRYSRGDGAVERSLHCPKGWQPDHRYPLAAGGANVVENIWCQPGPGMTRFDWKKKDHLDTRAWMEICHRGKDPKTIQDWFRGDWRMAYCTVFATDPDCNSLQKSH